MLQILVHYPPNSTGVAHGTKQRVVFKSTWAEFVAEGAGGMTAALLTSPLDVVKTRLQSDFYRPQLATSQTLRHQQALRPLPFFRSFILHFGETFQLLSSIYRIEGWCTLFKGLGPNLAEVVPSSAIKFYIYNSSKRFISNEIFEGHETPLVHLFAAGIAGVATNTATNSIWLVKTRLQLNKSIAEKAGSMASRTYKNAYECIVQVVQREGLRGLYRGLSASYLGVSESALHWILYEQLKKRLQKHNTKSTPGSEQHPTWDQIIYVGGRIGAAGSSKVFAVLVIYPHEVVRTRLRQAPISNGQLKYTGILQCFRAVWMEESLMAMYGGLTPHFLRAVPSTAIIFGVYEAVLKLFVLK